MYTHRDKALAMLIEGDFASVFTNRVKPVQLQNPKEKGKDNKMLVIADSDSIKNQVHNGAPLELGHDKWTNKTNTATMNF